MPDNLETRLRACADNPAAISGYGPDLLREAADEIHRLTAEVQQARDAIYAASRVVQARAIDA